MLSIRRAIPSAPGAPRPLGARASPRRAAASGSGARPRPRQAGRAARSVESPSPAARDQSGHVAAAAADQSEADRRHAGGAAAGNTPKDEYDLGYGYVLHKDYGLAEQTFRAFLQKYPSDRLAPEAQYWLGEALFQNQQYRDAAESFLAVSTKYETTARAPDALLRLGQSLAALGEKEAACASLGEVLRKYPTRLAQREAERGSGTKACPLLNKPFAMTKRTRCSRGLEDLRGLILAVSGGPDSTALLVLAARWAKRLKRAPKLVAVTVDHGLRAEAAREAAAVKRLARKASASRIARCAGAAEKPKSGLQEAARIARYRLLAQAAARAGYAHILTAHTLDDQAETILFRLARGSGLVGLAGMAHASPLPLAGGGRSLSGAPAACICPRRGLSRRCKRRASAIAKIRAIAIRALRARGCAA